MSLIRSALFAFYMVALTLIMGLGSLVLRLFFRRAALPYAKLWAAGLLGGLRVLCGIRYSVTGLERLPKEGPCLIASQHQSAFDALVWMGLLDRPSYVMKQELTKIPLVGPMLLLTGMMPVERTAGARALRGLLRETEKAVELQKQVVIFPEGTRTAPGEHVALKPGIAAMARHGLLAVYPVVTDSGLRWGKSAFLKRPGMIHIVVGPAIPAAATGGGRADLLGAIEASWRALEVAEGLCQHI